MIRFLRAVSRETAVLPIRAWRLTSRLLPPRCKYHPTCSRYCLDCIRTLGVLRGAAHSVWRLLRCNPWSLGGIDPVPEPPTRRRNTDGLPPRRR